MKFSGYIKRFGNWRTWELDLGCGTSPVMTFYPDHIDCKSQYFYVEGSLLIAAFRFRIEITYK